MRKLLFALTFLLGSWSTLAAAQQERMISEGYETGWYLLGGLTGGGAFASSGDSGFLGGEASVVGLRRGFWYGVYTDAAYDFGQETAVITAGPEFGYMIFGVDGGVGFRPSEEEGLEMGPQGRLLLTFGLFALYGRISHWPEATSHRTVRQFGALLKFPLVAPWGFGSSAPWDMGGN